MKSDQSIGASNAEDGHMKKVHQLQLRRDVRGVT